MGYTTEQLQTLWNGFARHPVFFKFERNKGIIKFLRDMGFERYREDRPSLHTQAGTDEIHEKANYIFVGVNKHPKESRRIISYGSVPNSNAQGITFQEFVNLCNNIAHSVEKGAKPMNKPIEDKNLVQDVAEYIRPYKKYILAAAVLLCIDHFFLKGELRNRTLAVIRKVADKIIKLLEAGADTLLGDEKKDPTTPTT